MAPVREMQIAEDWEGAVSQEGEIVRRGIFGGVDFGVEVENGRTGKFLVGGGGLVCCGFFGALGFGEVWRWMLV